ncbi:MAG: hypothetical protein ACFCUE_14485 [Candidatus Bathyarchaeia archaeon]|jgi:hypothetical protein
MNRKIVLSAAIIFLLLTGLIAYISYTGLGETNKEQKPFLTGVTYGGNNVQDAKTLIDKVASYTNLFVLQSGVLKNNATAVNEVGDYAVAKGLHFASYFDVLTSADKAEWVGTAKQRWRDMFAGVYLGDEPGGKMLDGDIYYTNELGITLNRNKNGIVNYRDGNEYVATFYLDGTIVVQRVEETSSSVDPTNSSVTMSSMLRNTNTTTYKPNGTITVRETIVNSTSNVYTGGLSYAHINAGHSADETLKNDFYTMENGSNRIAQEETYQQVASKNPLTSCDGAAEVFVNKTGASVADLKNQWNIRESDFRVFTADYGLYWWDYKSGYDMVLGELGWNNSVAQEIALVRGAASLQGKSWGTIITWKYTHAPFLTDGAEMFDQMKASYKAGAEYVVIFNYAKDMTGPYGTLQEDHFQALERFWNQVVQNPAEVHGSDKAEAVLVLPENYGWGMRNPSDTIWGIWTPNSTSQQIWSQLQQRLDQYGLKLDIVYDFSTSGKYHYIYYWNQTT